MFGDEPNEGNKPDLGIDIEGAIGDVDGGQCPRQGKRDLHQNDPRKDKALKLGRQHQVDEDEGQQEDKEDGRL